MWVHAPRQLPDDLDEKVTSLIGRREDREDASWLNVETGARVILAANGGWREAERSAFYAMHISPTGVVTDVSHGLLGGAVAFDASATGADTYSAQRRAAVEHLENLLQVVPSRFRS